MQTDFINKIYDKDTKEEVDVSKVCISSSPIWRFVIDGCPVSKNNTYMIEYRCFTCDRVNICSLNNVVKKIAKGNRKCPSCSGGCSVIEKIDKSKIAFSELDQDLQNSYFLKYLTLDEFSIIRGKIISIQNDKFTDTSVFEYIETYQIHDDKASFQPMLYDNARDVIERPINIRFQCENCLDTFICLELFKQKNKSRILCNDCKCKHLVQINTVKNVLGDAVKCRSKFELKFVKWCNENNIEVINGPILCYNADGIAAEVPLPFRVAFYLKKYNLLLDLEENVKRFSYSNKKNKLRKEAIHAYCNNEKQYTVIHQYNYIKFLKSLLRT